MNILKHLKALGERAAITDSNGSFSYSELYKLTNSYLTLLSEIKEGSVVAILSDYNFYAIALFLSLYEKKCIIVPIVSNHEEEVSKRLNVVKCNVQVEVNSYGELNISRRSDFESHPLIKKLSCQNNSGLVLFSSGSTGEPKAMIHDLSNMIKGYSNKKIRNLNIMVFLMFDHIGGLNTLLNAIMMGAFIILPEVRKPANIAQLIEENKVHLLPASPTFLNMMLIGGVNEKYDLSSLKMITYGTEPMPVSLLKRLKNEFPKVKFLQTFGTSETGIIKTSSRSSDSIDIKLNDPKQEIKIVDNELYIRSKTQILGYLNNFDETNLIDGWFKTGDLVEEVANGYLRIIGRKNEVINVGGEKVLPIEVESVLMELSFVVDASVCSEPNAITGQSVVASLVIDDGTNLHGLKKTVRKHCRSKLATYKIPTKILVVDNIKSSERYKKIRSN